MKNSYLSLPLKSTSNIHLYSDKYLTSVLDLKNQNNSFLKDDIAQTNQAKLSLHNQKSKQLKIDNTNKKYFTYNNMQEELGWLLNKWRKQAFLKIITMFIFSTLISLTICSNHNKLIWSLFFYSSFSFMNQSYMRLKKLKTWILLSQIVSTYILTIQLFALLLSAINPHNLCVHSMYSHFIVIPALNSAVLFLFLAKFSTKLVFPFSSYEFYQNLKNLMLETPKKIINVFWSMKHILIQIEIVMLFVSYVIMAYLFSINSIQLLYDIFRFTTILTTFLTVFMMLLIQHLIEICVSIPIKKDQFLKEKYLQINKKSKIPKLLELLRLNSNLHKNVDRKLMKIAYQRCLQWLVYNKIDLNFNAVECRSDKNVIKDFMSTEIQNSQFYKQYLDIFKQFLEDYLTNFILKDIAKYDEVCEHLFVLNKINRASLTIDLFYPFRIACNEIKKYYYLIEIINNSDIMGNSLEIISGLYSQSVELQNDQYTLMSLNIILQKLETVHQGLQRIIQRESQNNYSKQPIQGLTNKIERVLVQFKSTQTFSVNKASCS